MRSVDVFIGDRLREIREKELMLSQMKLATEIDGYTQAAICRIERNDSPTPLHLAKEIRKKFRNQKLLDDWINTIHRIAAD